MNAFIWILAIFIFLLDRFSKIFVLQNLELNESVKIIKNIFYLTLVHNTGAAFGIFKDQTLFFIIISILAVITIVIYIKKFSNIPPAIKIGLALILGGALGNIVDRLCFGYVVDFLDFKIWPVFNIADSAITVGTFLLIVNLMTKRQVGN
ncbi:MAG: signal peptidase II [Candidatus Omnitrophota bacterium]|nr:MAG: signal peptidase II [Candidatus Omnitrophota bacterium]